VNESQHGLRGRTASPSDDADRAVLALVTAGQLDALQDLYDRYKTLSYSIALRITADGSLAEDVVQEAFLGVWRNAGRYVEGRGSVKTWLLSIVHHRAVDAVRREQAQRRRAEQAARLGPGIVEDPIDDVLAAIDLPRERKLVRSALGELPEEQREVIQRMYFEGLSQSQIAERTGLPLGTVKSHTLLAMRRLRAHLGEGSR